MNSSRNLGMERGEVDSLRRSRRGAGTRSACAGVRGGERGGRSAQSPRVLRSGPSRSCRADSRARRSRPAAGARPGRPGRDRAASASGYQGQNRTATVYCRGAWSRSSCRDRASVAASSSARVGRARIAWCAAMQLARSANVPTARSTRSTSTRRSGPASTRRGRGRRYADRADDPDAFVAWLAPLPGRTAARALAPTGSLFVHLDYRAVHYVKVALDRLFGARPLRQRDRLVLLGRRQEPARRSAASTTPSSGTRAAPSYAFYPDAVRVPRASRLAHARGARPDGAPVQEKTDRRTGRVYRYPVAAGKVPEDWWADIETLNRGDASAPAGRPEARAPARADPRSRHRPRRATRWPTGSPAPARPRRCPAARPRFVAVDRERRRRSRVAAARRLAAQGRALARRPGGVAAAPTSSREFARRRESSLRQPRGSACERGAHTSGEDSGGSRHLMAGLSMTRGDDHATRDRIEAVARHRRRHGPRPQRGLRVRRPRAASSSSSPTAWAATPPARSPARWRSRRCTATLEAARAEIDGVRAARRPTTAGAGWSSCSRARCSPPTRRSTSAAQAESRQAGHGHDARRRAGRRAPRRSSPTSATAAPT